MLRIGFGSSAFFGMIIVGGFMGLMLGGAEFFHPSKTNLQTSIARRQSEFDHRQQQRSADLAHQRAQQALKGDYERSVAISRFIAESGPTVIQGIMIICIIYAAAQAWRMNRSQRTIPNSRATRSTLPSASAEAPLHRRTSPTTTDLLRFPTGERAENIEAKSL